MSLCGGSDLELQVVSCGGRGGGGGCGGVHSLSGGGGERAHQADEQAATLTGWGCGRSVGGICGSAGPGDSDHDAARTFAHSESESVGRPELPVSQLQLTFKFKT